MPTPDEHSLDSSRPGVAESYGIHPLLALDGVMIHVTLNGETVDTYFGENEEAAAEAVARELPHVLPIADDDGGPA